LRSPAFIMFKCQIASKIETLTASNSDPSLKKNPPLGPKIISCFSNVRFHFKSQWYQSDGANSSTWISWTSSPRTGWRWHITVNTMWISVANLSSGCWRTPEVRGTMRGIIYFKQKKGASSYCLISFSLIHSIGASSRGPFWWCSGHNPGQGSVAISTMSRWQTVNTKLVGVALARPLCYLAMSKEPLYSGLGYFLTKVRGAWGVLGIVGGPNF
jgi:hypothetical protein